MEYLPSLASRESATPPDARRLRILYEESAHSATLRDKSGATLCRLPCTAWLPPHAEWSIHVLDVNEDTRRVEIPESLDDVVAGGSATVIARPKRGHPGAAMSLFLTGFPLSILGLLCVGIAPKSGPEGTNDSNPTFLAAGIGLLAVGLPMIIGGGAWWSYSRSPSVEVLSR